MTVLTLCIGLEDTLLCAYFIVCSFYTMLCITALMCNFIMLLLLLK